MASNATILENKIKDKLGIRWVDARSLALNAQATLGISAADDTREDEILLQALKSFVALPKEEQESMRRKKSEASEEPEWKRKAREQAERREQEWAKAQAEAAAKGESKEGEENREPIHTRITQSPPQAVSGPKKIVRVTKTVTKSNGDTHVVESTEHKELQGPSVKVTRVVCCVIL